MLEGMVVFEVVNAFSMTVPMLSRLKVPKIPWILVRVSVMQFVPESVRQRIFLAVG